MEFPHELVGKAVVYVPRPGALEPRVILPRSGIVGEPRAGSDRVLVYFEGAKGRPLGMEQLADRLYFAYSRLLTDAPIVAFAALPHEVLEPVGTWDHGRGAITLLDEDAERALAAWLEVDVVDPEELHSRWRR